MENHESSQFNSLVSLKEIHPSELFIIPIFDYPIFPGMVTPIIVQETNMIAYLNKLPEGKDFIGVVMTLDPDSEEINTNNLHSIGTVGKILKKITLPEGGINLLINATKRFQILEFIKEEPIMICKVEYIDDTLDDEMDKVEIKALMRTIIKNLKTVAEVNPFLNEQIKLTMANIDEPSRIADFVASLIRVSRDESQEILEMDDVKAKLNRVLKLLHDEVKVIQLQKNIQKQIDDKITKQQREYFLREQLKAIRMELGMENDPKTADVDRFAEKIKKLKLQEDVAKSIYDELDKFSTLEQASPEYAVSRNYLELIVNLPWNKTTKENKDLTKAVRILESDHYGLKDVKERIIEFLAVRKLKSAVKGSIVCLVGPPGVGKTSLGKSIARCMNRKFYRFSLGGMQDEAEIKGHRRTYIGAMPGKILQALKYVGTNNPVIMLDEIDKLGSSYRGDPASALLEVLDPEQNSNFIDHYLDLPFDLSNVFFILTANELDTIPQPLLDRMEVIRLSGYIEKEKIEIAKKYLVPKQLEQHGLDKRRLSFQQSALSFMINSYAREAGVRSLERVVEKVIRKSAALIAQEKKAPKSITPKLAESYLGKPIFIDDPLIRIQSPGVVIGLAWTSYGGATLFIESLAMPSGPGLQLTGQLGDVMSESASIALSYVKSIAYKYGIAKGFFNQNMIHLHVPAGATPKDGPSAGITMATSILSLSTGKRIKDYLGMTGELTLSGVVLPIGGLKEKVIAAKRNKINTILFPKENLKDFEEIPEYIKENMVFHPVATMEEVITFAFPEHTFEA